jgi:hypothetical protein
MSAIGRQVPQSFENYFWSEKDATVTAMNSITDSRITYTSTQAIANSPPTPIAGSEQSGSNSTPAVAQTTASGPSISSNAASAIATLNGILGQQPIATKSFSEVTTDARATLNANYASLKAAGTPINYDTITQKELDTAFKGLDRRSLFAIASNSQNLFTSQEQTWAQGAMSAQQASAMGLGQPTVFIQNPSAGFLTGIQFLNSVSPEEKASTNWKVNMAGLQSSYEQTYSENNPGKAPQSFNNTDPIVELLVKAINSGTAYTVTNGSYVTDISKIALFENGKNSSELAQILADQKVANNSSINT